MSILVIALLIYYQGQEDAANLGQYVEAERVCHETAMQISAVVSAGSGTEAAFLRPQIVAARNYTLRVSGSDRSASVEIGGKTAFCRLATSNISNGTHASFYINQDTTIRNVGGGVVIG
jgi:hypothetical protein